ncbi:hypothetical protein BLA29_007248 [Euroglyphus maynei]|uniref:Uncharacterized protein n=1 Tax=Euroglyphus maynei TaxID=6958 RepID=A0A1Y3B154_EURMA|nr:hypothetical protein BLA29_007248 [Euroglyphus maynei]
MEVMETKEPDYFQDMVPEFKKPKTVYVNKHDHPTVNINDGDENGDDELNKMERKFRFQKENQVNNNHLSLMNETNFINQFGSIDDNIQIPSNY